MELDDLMKPDVIITKNPSHEPEYEVEPLFHDVVYPVRSPACFEPHFHGKKIKPLDLLSHPSLHPSLQERTQVCEHVDWRVWRNCLRKGDDSDCVSEDNDLESNDYRLQVGLGQLLRPVSESIVFNDRHHYLITHRNAHHRQEYQQLPEWLLAEVGQMMNVLNGQPA